VQPFLDGWLGAGGEGLASYAAGSEGPRDAHALIERDQRRWRTIGGREG
jgi:glucose-6-phosphate 1-dehydrogenase